MHAHQAHASDRQAIAKVHMHFFQRWRYCKCQQQRLNPAVNDLYSHSRCKMTIVVILHVAGYRVNNCHYTNTKPILLVPADHLSLLHG